MFQNTLLVHNYKKDNIYIEMLPSYPFFIFFYKKKILNLILDLILSIRGCDIFTLKI